MWYLDNPFLFHALLYLLIAFCFLDMLRCSSRCLDWDSWQVSEALKPAYAIGMFAFLPSCIGWAATYRHDAWHQQFLMVGIGAVLYLTTLQLLSRLTGDKEYFYKLFDNVVVDFGLIVFCLVCLVTPSAVVQNWLG